jgi:pimeloyl-ACP methyl ester carboxylesterase
MRVALGEDSPAFPWLVQCLRQSDPDMLTALIDQFEATATGYEMEQYMPAIKCPVLLLQADPNGGGLMTDDEVRQALALLQKPAHTRLEGVSHILHNQHKGPAVTAIRAFVEAH